MYLTMTVPTVPSTLLASISCSECDFSCFSSCCPHHGHGAELTPGGQHSHRVIIDPHWGILIEILQCALGHLDGWEDDQRPAIPPTLLNENPLWLHSSVFEEAADMIFGMLCRKPTEAFACMLESPERQRRRVGRKARDAKMNASSRSRGSWG